MLGLGTLVSHGFGLSLVPALLPRIEDSFGSGYGPLGAAVAAGLVGYAAGGLAASRLLDSLPNRTVLNGTFAFTGLALLGASAAASPIAIAVPTILMGASAPISWAATTHVVARAIVGHARSLVMGAAAGGVGLGVIVNGILVQFFVAPGDWRRAFLVAATLTAVVIAASALVFRTPIDRPSHSLGAELRQGSYRRVMLEWPGRVVVFGSIFAAVCSFTFITFLTTTAIDEMRVSATAAGALLWGMGGLGVLASLVLGGQGDRGSPVAIVAGVFAVCGIGLGLLAVAWSYPTLIAASLAVAVLNYPVWGLLAIIASRRFDPSLALRAVSLGLVGAASLAALTNVAAGGWIDRVGSMRLPTAVLSVLSLGVGVFLTRYYRLHVAD